MLSTLFQPCVTRSNVGKTTKSADEVLVFLELIKNCHAVFNLKKTAPRKKRLFRAAANTILSVGTWQTHAAEHHERDNAAPIVVESPPSSPGSSITLLPHVPISSMESVLLVPAESLSKSVPLQMSTEANGATATSAGTMVAVTTIQPSITFEADASRTTTFSPATPSSAPLEVKLQVVIALAEFIPKVRTCLLQQRVHHHYV